MGAVPRHQCLIYEGSPAKHLPGLAAIIGRGLRANTRCLYLNSPAMVAGIRSYLAATGLDVAEEVRRGALVLSSDQTHLLNGHFDVQAMLQTLANAVEHALKDGYQGLWASGDMTWELGGEQNVDKLLEYEYGLEELFHRYPALSGICQYHQDTLPAIASQQGLYAHRALYVSESLSRLNPHYARLEWQARERPKLRPAEFQEMLSRVRQAGD